MKRYEVTVHNVRYETTATSAAKAVNNIRWRENLRYLPLSEFHAREVRR